MSKIVLSEYINPSLGNHKVFMEDAEDAFGNKGKHLHMAGIFIQGGIRNANQRVYPVNEIKNAVDTIKTQLHNKLDILGEMDHPADLKINLDRVTHSIVTMEMDGANGIGKLKLLPTPMGNIIKTMLESGIKLGVSSRGSGNVNEATGHVSDFEIITVDIVAQPSAPAAYPTPVYESMMNRRYGHKMIDMSKESLEDKRVQKFVRQEVLGLIKEMKLR
jgi:hypothetical protein